jgi:SAM-dependent methyltransferase
MTGGDGSDDALVRAIRAAYAGSSAGWAAGPALVYRRLAAALVATADQPLAGGLVLDLGAGTGVASAALSQLGARVVAVDLAVEMLLHERARRPPGVAADAQALPFRAATFDAVVAAFSLNHVPDLDRALTECRRVSRSGGELLASTFPRGGDHPAKSAVEEVLERYGYRRPGWYATFKDRVAEVTGDADRFVRAASAAGLRQVHIDQVEVDAGLDDPRLAVDWRLNMPQTLGFLTALEPRVRDELRGRAIAALGTELPSTVSLLALRGRIP